MIGSVFVVLALILLNGLFAMSELALMSSRRTRLQALADGGSRGAAKALRLLDEPSEFLSTVQVGITLIGILAGAFSGATLSGPVAEALVGYGVGADLADEFAFGLVVAAITYLSLIVGELVPKQLALRRPEAIAAAMAGPMGILSILAHPAVVLLAGSTRLVLRLMGSDKPLQQTVTQEEIRSLLAEGHEAGVVEAEEKAMIERLMRLADRPVSAVMTPRPEVTWIDLERGLEGASAVIRSHGFSRYPVGRGSIEDVVGILRVKDLTDRLLAGETPSLDSLLIPSPVVSETADILRVLEILKAAPVHMALVVDEYGSPEGIVTVTDIMAAILGGLPEHHALEQPVRRADGSWLLDAAMPVDEVVDLLGLKDLPTGGGFHTLAGLVLAHLRAIPQVGERFDLGGWQWEVMDMDGRRIDKLLASAPPAESAGEG